MKRQNFQYNYQYYNHLSRSRFSSRTSRRLKSENGDSITNRSKTRFYHRVEKACTTFSNNDLSKELNLCRKEIERLEKELLKKDKVIFEMKEINMHNKEIESQLIEVYRVLYMYEGKIGEYQKEMKKLEAAIASKMPQDVSHKVEELLESYRLENGELGAHIQQKNRVIMQLDGRLKKLENKYFSAAWKLSSAQRQISNPLKKRFPNLRNTITINQTPLLEKQKALKFRQQTKNPVSLRNQYNFQTQISSKDRQNVKFKRVQASTFQQDYKPATNKLQSGENQQNMITPPSITYSDNYGKHNTYDNDGNRVAANKQTDYQKVTYSKEAVLIGHQNAQSSSNPNISSQTAINTGVVRRIQGGRVYRQQSPNKNVRADQAANSSNGIMKMQILGQGVMDVQNMMKNSAQNRYVSPTLRSGGNIQSIYLN